MRLVSSPLGENVCELCHYHDTGDCPEVEGDIKLLCTTIPRGYFTDDTTLSNEEAAWIASYRSLVERAPSQRALVIVGAKK